MFRQLDSENFARAGVDFARFRRHSVGVLNLSEDQRRTLAKWISERVAFLGYSQAELARRTNLSDTTLRDTIQAKKSRITTPTVRSIENGLGWAPGSIEAIITGGSPTETDRGPVPDPYLTSAPAAFDGRLNEELTPDELREVEAFARGLITARRRRQGL